MKRARQRQGFTLMEVMMAITITALVATVAAAALRAGLDVRERVGTHRLTVDAEARAMEWLSTMLRHPPEANAVTEPLLQITHLASGSDSVVFLTRSASPTAGTGAIWRVSLHADMNGLHVNAASTRDVSAAPVLSLLPHIRTVRADALNPASGNSEWLREWPVLRSAPAALRLTFGLIDGSTQSPMVFVMSPLALGAR